MRLVRGKVVGTRYRAEALLARGGMGEVWRCTDLESRTAVAVKVLREIGADPRRVRLFRDEVHATARLDHPAIVRVFDLVESEDGLALVMELRQGEPLSKIRRMPFPMLRSVLCQVLQALAYAHSRGVLHLDVKPGNVMVDIGGEDAAASLVDFGIARVWRGGPEPLGSEPGMLAGTVAYMAPEQLMGLHHSFGPWTDLFAFGAMVYRLVCGRGPFDGHEPAQRVFMHPPPIDTRALGLPDGLGAMLHALLSPREADRPTHAADALHALRHIEAPRDTTLPVGGDSGQPSSVTLTDARPAGSTGVETAPIDAPPAVPDLPGSDTSSVLTGSVPLEDLPLSLDERRADPPPGAFALFGLREMPVVGRVAEREEMWRALRAVRADRTPRVVVIGGPPGMGKSRAARDALERAHEHGLACTAWTKWSRAGTGDEGLRALADNILDTATVPDLELPSHLRRWTERFPGVDDARFNALAAQLLRPDAAGTYDADLALRVTGEAIERMSARRSAAIWLDDAQWSDGAAASLCELLRARGVAAVVLVTFREDGGPPPVDADVTIDLPPLDRSDSRKLLRGLLDMEPSLLDLLCARMDGNPLLATLLVEDLIAEKAVARHRGRHSLREGLSQASIPEGMATLWQRRIERSGADHHALQAFAVTRERIGEPVLERLAELQGAGFLHAVQAAERAGLIRRDGDHRQLVHGLLREHVIGTVAGERRAGLHAVAAEALAVLVGREDVQEERALHQHAAGSVGPACEAMREAIGWSARRTDDARRARRAALLAEWAADAGLAGQEAYALAEQAHLLASQGDAAGAATLLVRAVAIEKENGLEQPWVALRRSQVERLAARSEVADALCEQALQLARSEADGEVQTHALGQLGLSTQRRGDREGARELFQQAAALARERGDLGTEARALLHVANLAPAESGALFEQAIDSAVQAGALLVELSARQVYADALFMCGERERARREMTIVGAQARARRARQLVSIVEIQLATWALHEEDAALAEAHAGAARASGADRGSRVERCMLAAIEATAAAMHGDAGRVAECLARLADERGDYDEEDLRKVLSIGLSHAPEPCVPRFEAALRVSSGSDAT